MAMALGRLAVASPARMPANSQRRCISINRQPATRTSMMASL